MVHTLITSEDGVVVSLELVLVGVVLLVGLVLGLSAVRDSVVSELSDVAGSVQDTNQSIVYRGVGNGSSRTAGANFEDATDVSDDADDVAGAADNGITFDAPPTNEDLGIRPPSLSGIQSGQKHSGSTHQFTWSANGTPDINYWWMYIGSNQGSANYYNSGSSLGLNTSQTVTGLPTDGSAVWVRLWYRDGNGWSFTDNQYTAHCP